VEARRGVIVGGLKVKNGVPVPVPSRTILLASVDPILTNIRTRVLEAAGYCVIVAGTVSEISSGFLNTNIDLVLMGLSVPAAEKRMFWAECRNRCSLILELYTDGPPELMDDPRTYVHHPVTSMDFLEAVESLLAAH
jgi:hypothetical protein